MILNNVLQLSNQLIFVNYDGLLAETLSSITSRKYEAGLYYNIPVITDGYTSFLRTKDTAINSFNKLLKLRMFDNPFMLDYVVKMEMLRNAFIYTDLVDVYEIIENEDRTLSVFNIKDLEDSYILFLLTKKREGGE